MPVIVKAVLVGLLISVSTTGPWGALAMANLRVLPSVPWSIAPMAAYLWLYWRYLGGWGWPRGTAEQRKRSLRATAPPPRVWRWSLAAGGLAVATMSAVSQLARHFSPPVLPYWWPLVSAVPPFTLLCLLLMAAVVAGIAEEAAFRGYMQSMIERRHGPTIAIALVALVFTLAHLTTYPAMPLGLFLGLLAISLAYGVLAYLSGSILPGLVIHASGDAVGLLLGWWFRDALRFPPFSETGADVFFWLDCVAVAVLAVLTVGAYRRLARVARGA